MRLKISRLTRLYGKLNNFFFFKWRYDLFIYMYIIQPGNSTMIQENDDDILCSSRDNDAI